MRHGVQQAGRSARGGVGGKGRGGDYAWPSTRAYVSPLPADGTSMGWAARLAASLAAFFVARAVAWATTVSHCFQNGDML